MLLAESGKPLIQHTYEAASQSSLARRVVVATDHDEIFRAVDAFGGEVVMTGPDHASGTDRVAEVAVKFNDVDLIVNVQGDEPEISADSIDTAIRLLSEKEDCAMSTLATPIRNRDQLNDPACVKVVVDSENHAIYFSRSVIPHPRSWNNELLAEEPPVFLQHVGLYVYRRDFLLNYAKLPPARIELVESLEQLRVLEHGYRMRVVETRCADHEFSGFSVDTIQDVQRAEAMLRQRGLG